MDIKAKFEQGVAQKPVKFELRKTPSVPLKSKFEKNNDIGAKPLTPLKKVERKNEETKTEKKTEKTISKTVETVSPPKKDIREIKTAEKQETKATKTKAVEKNFENTTIVLKKSENKVDLSTRPELKKTTAGTKSEF